MNHKIKIISKCKSVASTVLGLFTLVNLLSCAGVCPIKQSGDKQTFADSDIGATLKRMYS